MIFSLALDSIFALPDAHEQISTRRNEDLFSDVRFIVFNEIFEGLGIFSRRGRVLIR